MQGNHLSLSHWEARNAPSKGLWVSCVVVWQSEWESFWPGAVYYAFRTRYLLYQTCLDIMAWREPLLRMYPGRNKSFICLQCNFTQMVSWFHFQFNTLHWRQTETRKKCVELLFQLLHRWCRLIIENTKWSNGNSYASHHHITKAKCDNFLSFYTPYSMTGSGKKTLS